MKSYTSYLVGKAVVGLFVFAAIAMPLRAQIAYGLSFYDNELFTLDGLGTGSLIGVVNANVTGYGLAFRGNDLYLFDPNVDRILKINTTNAQVENTIDVGVGDLLGEGDLSFRSDGMGFLASALAPDFTPTNDLFRFDITSGTSVRIGSTSTTLNGLAFVGNTLYGLGKEGDPSLYIVNQTTAALTPVGSLGVMAGSPFGALSAGANGQLYGIVDDRLYTIDRTTGHASVVDPTVLDVGFASVSGLAMMPPLAIAPVPEPSTYGLFGCLALIGSVFIRRRFTRSRRLTS